MLRTTHQSLQDQYSNSIDCINNLLNILDQTRDSLGKNDVSNENKMKILDELRVTFEQSNASEIVKENNKKINSLLVKLGKTIDSLESPEVRKIKVGYKAHADTCEDQSQLLVQSILSHFLRNSDRIDLVKAIEIESGIEANAHTKDAYSKIHHVLEYLGDTPEIANENINSLLDWVATISDPFKEEIGFETHKFKFLYMASLNEIESCVAYARNQLTQFPTYADETRALMSCFVFMSDTALSDQYKKLKGLVIRALCAQYGLPSTSLLATALDAGKVSLQQLQKYIKVTALANAENIDDIQQSTSASDLLNRLKYIPSNTCSEEDMAYMDSSCSSPAETSTSWLTKNEFPVDVQVPNSVFHTSFVCPVARTDGDNEDYPVLLSCGHVILHQSMMKIARPRGAFKCPTCQSSTTVESSMRIFFQ